MTRSIFFVHTRHGVRGPYCTTCRKKLGAYGDALDGCCRCAQTPEARAKGTEACRAYWQDPEHRRAQAARARKRWDGMSPEARAAHGAAIARGRWPRQPAATDPAIA